MPAAVTPGPDTTGSLDIVMSNVVNGVPLVLGTQKYTNANSDTFIVNTYKYYFTNIRLTTSGGYAWSPAESYYLVDQSNPSSLILHVSGIPRASYSSIEFMIGVDKNRNTSGAQTGALDPANGMFWSWNTGYIMAKLEGTSPQSGDNYKKLTFHLGGFSGAFSVLRSVQLPFPNAAQVTETHKPQVNMNCDVAEWFKTPNTISFGTVYGVTTSNTNAKNIADNYADMFTITSVVN
ncbi:MAG: hypothetical protein JST26_02095 [Bacteroidetes bacterium]|nr:hypothetical protein [Bacteroidota bacterium]